MKQHPLALTAAQIHRKLTALREKAQRTSKHFILFSANEPFRILGAKKVDAGVELRLTDGDDDHTMIVDADRLCLIYADGFDASDGDGLRLRGRILTDDQLEHSAVATVA